MPDVLLSIAKKKIETEIITKLYIPTISQFGPEKPAVQRQLQVTTPLVSTQEPPFLHGFAAHPESKLHHLVVIFVLNTKGIPIY